MVEAATPKELSLAIAVPSPCMLATTPLLTPLPLSSHTTKRVYCHELRSTHCVCLFLLAIREWLILCRSWLETAAMCCCPRRGWASTPVSSLGKSLVARWHSSDYLHRKQPHPSPSLSPSPNRPRLLEVAAVVAVAVAKLVMGTPR